MWKLSNLNDYWWIDAWRTNSKKKDFNIWVERVRLNSLHNLKVLMFELLFETWCFVDYFKGKSSKAAMIITGIKRCSEFDGR